MTLSQSQRKVEVRLYRKDNTFSLPKRQYLTLPGTQHVPTLRDRKNEETRESFGMNLHMSIRFTLIALENTTH